ncbi:MAG TPA: outer membrane beta-barrel protein [Flavisolibacter sp.]|jgi:opacity protein-like surface antigen
MKLNKITIVAAALFLGVTAQAQQKGKAQLDIHYNVALPAGSLKQTIDETSFRGAKASFLFGLTDKLAIGFGTGFQDFYKKSPRQTYKLDDGSDLSAVRSFSVQTIPLLVQAKYQFSPGSPVQPYAALGVGGNLVNYNDLAGEFTLEQKVKVGFAARPEAGIYIPFRKGGESGLSLGASYSIMPFNSYEVSNLNSIGIHAGVSIPLRK